MPTTRRMAREASVVLEDKENEMPPSLRKMPVRRTTAKANNTRDRKARATALPADEVRNSAMPLSPKKNVQMPQTRGRLRNSKEISCTDKPDTRTQSQVSDGIRGTRGQPRSATREATDMHIEVDQESQQDPAPTQATLHATNLAKPAGRQKKRSKARTSTVDREPNLQYAKNRSLQETGTNGQAQYNTSIPSRIQSPLGGPFNVDLEPDASEDEICGPNTPLIRGVTDNHTILSPSRGRSTIRETFKSPAKTPSSKMMVYRSNEDYFSHTQKVPLKPAADVTSPRRPMSVARGSTVAYVFHPLPKASRAHSPLTGPYQWPATPSEDGGNVNDQKPTSPFMRRSRSQTPSGSSSDRSHDARDHLIQIFTSESSDEEAEGEDDGDVKASFPKLQSWSAFDNAANADYIPEEPSMSELDHCSDLEDDESMEDSTEVTELAPELHSELMQSTPLQPAPALTQEDFDSLLDSDDELGETPSMTRFSNLTDSSARPTPRPTVSFAIDDSRTPETNRRQSALAFKTPRMHSALDEFDDLPQSVHSDRNLSGQTLCIDPSLLQQDSQFQTTDASLTVHFDAESPAKPIPTLASGIVPAQMAPLTMSPGKPASRDRGAPRLSLYLNTEDLVETPELEQSAWLDNVDTTVIVKENPRTEMNPIDSEETGSFNSSVHSVVVVSQSPTTPEDQTELHPGTPHYAPPTISYDIRRKSMPVALTRTPQQDIRFRNAETQVKPAATPSFAQAWLQRRSLGGSLTPSRRQSMMDLNAPPPSSPSISTPRQPPSLLPRSTSTLSLRSKSSLPQLRSSPSTHSTPTPAGPLTPRPRCYTPTAPFETLKQASTTRPSALSRSPFKLHPSPRKPATPARPSPRKEAQAPFTPHPSAPLRGVMAMVDVRARSGADAGPSFVTALRRLGASITASLAPGVTHLVFKNGSADALAEARRRGVLVVGSRWVTDCDALGRRVPEIDQGYAVPALLPGDITRQERRESGASHVDSDEDWESPAGPQVRAPGSVPVRRVKKLDLGRRLTAWEE